MGEKQLKWIRVAVSENEFQWNENGLCIIVANRKKITLALYNSILYAFAYKCPHAGGILAEGKIAANGCITCPLHRYSFHLKSGFNTSGEGYFLKTYPVQQKEDGIYVGFTDESLFSF